MPDYEKYAKDAPATWIFDRTRLLRLAHAYADAIAKQQDEFIFDGRKLVTKYAKYLIDYLENELESK